MLETEIKKLTKAVEANTAALLNGGAPAAAPAEQTDPPAASAPEPAAPPPADDSVSYDDLVAKFTELGKKSRDAAIGLLGEYGAAKLPDIKKTPEKFAEIAAKIDAKLAS